MGAGLNLIPNSIQKLKKLRLAGCGSMADNRSSRLELLMVRSSIEIELSVAEKVKKIIGERWVT